MNEFVYFYRTIFLEAMCKKRFLNFQSVHKISSSGPPTISLQLVPKILAPLVSLWIPQAFVVSFKLETDETLLISKARNALNKYKHNVSNLNYSTDRN